MLSFQMDPGQGPTPRPAIFLLHGYMSDEQDLYGLGQEFVGNRVLVSIRAPHIMSQGFSWYQFKEGLTPDLPSVLNSLDLIAEVVDHVSSIVDIDRSKSIMGGFSQGGVMTAMWACRTRVVWGGAMILSGYLVPESCIDGMRMETRVFWGHGQEDPVVPYRLAEAGIKQLEGQGASVTFRSYPMGHTVSATEVHDIRTWLEMGP